MYQVKVKGKEFTVSLQNGVIRINDKELPWDMQSLDAGSYHVISGGDSYRIQLGDISADGKRLKLVINGATLEIELQDRYDLLLHKLGMDQQEGTEANQITAPMPGLILEVMVSEGQEVEEGQPLLVLEAMKMENVIKSTGTGSIKSIAVEQGQNVEKNQVLIHF